MNKLSQYLNLLHNMGLRYVVFRLRYALETKLGILERKFPVNPAFKQFIALAEWKQRTPLFFFKDRSDITLPKERSKTLQESFNEIQEGTFTFFSKLKFDLGVDLIGSPIRIRLINMILHNILLKYRIFLL